MPEKSEFDKALGELHDLTEWEDAEAAIREIHARGPEIERLYLSTARFSPESCEPSLW